MVAEASRDVIINLRYQLDKSSVADIRAGGKEVMSIQEQARKAAEQSAAGIAAAHKKSVDAQEKEQLRYGAALARQIDKEIKDRERQAKANEKFDNDFVRKGIANAERLEKARARAAEQSAAGIAAAQERQNAAMRNALSSAVQLGKGFAQLGLIGEDSTKKVIEGLVKIEAVANIAKGAMQLGDSIGKFSAAASAARAGGSAVGSVGGAAASGGPIAAAGIAAAAGVALAGVVLYEAITGTADKMNSVSMKIAEAEVGWAQWIRNKLPGVKFTGDTFETDELTKQQGKTAAMDKQRTNNLGAAAIAEADAKRQIALAAPIIAQIAEAELQKRLAGDAMRPGSDARSQADTRVGFARDSVAAAAARQAQLERQGTVTEAELNEARRQSIETVKAQREAELERAKTIAEIAREEVSAARQMAEAHRQAIDAAKARAAQDESSLRSAEEKFAALDPVKQRQAAEAARKAQRGEALTDAEKKVLGESGLGSANEGVQRGVEADARRRITAAGADDLFSTRRQDIQRRQEAIAAEMEEAATADLQAIRSAVESREKAQKELYDEMVKGIKGIKDAVTQALKDSADEQAVNAMIKNTSLASS